MMDFNNAEPQGAGGGDVIPAGTVAPVRINLRGIKTSTSRAQGLDMEYTVIAGPFAKRKAWSWNGFNGNGSDGHNKMVEITSSYLRALLESAYGVNPADDSPEAMAVRRLGDWQELDGVEFVARFEVEKGEDFTDGRTGEVRKGKDKNILRAVTPDDPDYTGFKPAKKGKAASNGSASKPAAAASQGGGQRPAWA